MIRGFFIGFIIGVLPGTGATIASFLSYATEKMVSTHPEEFGKGAIAGVAGPEGANNAAVAGAMVPLFTLGIPGSGTAGGDDGGDDDVGVPAGTACCSCSIRISSGGSSPACISGMSSC